MSGALIKVGLGAFFVWASSQMGALAGDLLGRARLSVQASELSTLDGHLAAWSVGSGFEKRRGGSPPTQAAFERTVSELFTERGGRRAFEDRWGSPYLYERLSDRPPGWRITSRGPDRKAGTADDLILERRGDAVHFNTDPVAIAEGAVARKRRHDEQVLKELERLRRSGPKATSGKPKTDAKTAGKTPAKAAPAKAAAPQIESLSPSERQRLERDLVRRSLTDLDALLKAQPGSK